ncbi:hypothetical protein ACCT18_01390 [Rhizobium ruizarguesonis]
MATTPEIKTKFTLDGLRQAATGLRGFARTVSDALSDARRRGGNVFDPMGRGLDAVERKTKTVAKELTRLGAAGTFRGIRVGALGASVAVGGLATKMSSLSAAALKAAKDSAASLKAISIDAQRIGGSTSDVAVLGYAADVTGTDRDELVTQIATISNEFLTLRESINEVAEEYETFLGVTAKEAALAKRLGNGDGLKSIISGFRAADLEARKASYTDIDDRVEQIDGDLNKLYASGDRRSGLYGDVARQALLKERRELEKASKEFEKSQSPQAQALFELQKYDIDFNRASKGGVEGLLAISEAFERIQDPSAKARVAMRLFGEDAGVKLIPLLNGGRKAVDEYRRTLEESGAIATKEDIANAEAYSRAVQNLKTATSGVQLTIGRALTPDLTRASQELTAWLIKSREEIAKIAVEAFRDTRIFAEDALSLFGGNTDDIKTPWLDSAVKKTVILRDVWADVRRQVKLLWEGKDADYGWLNALRDGFVEVKKFAVDAWAVVSGGNAANFDWLNQARDQVVAFARRFSDAYDMLKSVVKSLGDFFKPVLDYLGTDIATLGLFLGLTRMVGLFGALTTGAGLLMKALGGVFALGGGAIATGKAVAGVGGAAGAAMATASGLTSSLVTVGTTISVIIKSAALLGTSIAAGFALGQVAAKAFYSDTQKAYDNLFKQQAELIKAQDLGRVNELLRERGTDRARGFQGRYWGAEGINVGAAGMTTDEQIAAGREKFRQNGFGNDPSAYEGGRVYGGDVIGDSIRNRNAQQPSRTIEVKLDVAGRQTTLYGDEINANRFERDLDLATRGY